MENATLPQSKRVKVIFFSLMLGLLLLRFPFIISLVYGIIPIPKEIGTYIFYGGTYLMAAIMIFLKRDSLADYNIGLASLVIFMISPFVQLPCQYFAMETIQPDLWVRLAASVGLFMALLITRPKLRKRSFKELLLWLIVAIVVGIGIGVLTGTISSLQTITRSPEHPSALLVINLFFIQLGNAAAMEEPLFRGFLWGFLKQLHWKDCWIWLFQAALFWLGHIYYLGVANMSFWIIVPLGALILGLVVWRSKSIGTSMIVHGLFNSISDIVAHFTW